MKTMYLTVACLFTCLFGVGVSARAQRADTVDVSVPFEFVAGEITLPAGEYRVSRVNPSLSPEIAIRGYEKGNVFLIPLAFDDGTADQPTLSFEHVGGKYFLSKIKTLSGVYTVPTSREKVMLGKATSPISRTPSAAGGQ